MTQTHGNTVTEKTPLIARRERRRDALRRDLSMQRAADCKNASISTPPPTSSDTFRVKNALTKPKTQGFYPQEDIFCEFYEVKLGKQGFALRLEPVENTVDTLPALDKYEKTAVDALLRSLRSLPSFCANPVFAQKLAFVFGFLFTTTHKAPSEASDDLSAPKNHQKTVVDTFPALNKYEKTAVYGLPAFNKHPKTAVYGLPALDKHQKTTVDGFSALDKCEKTAVDGLSSLVERTKTAVDGILSRRGRVTTAVAALSCGFSARFALGYSITQKIKEYSV